MTDKTDTSKTQDVSVTLKKPHRHRGDLRSEGDTIRCRSDTAERLKEKGIA
jgi:hypothetical protein